MELRQLRYLIDVIDEASFTKAAAKAHVAQPGVSAQLRRLERELGQTLLDRSGGRVRPTRVGQAIVPYARAALGAIDGIRQTTDALAGLAQGCLALGSVTSISTPRVDLPAVLACFHRAHPGIKIRLIEATSGELITGLRCGELDIAIVGLDHEAPFNDIDIRTLAVEPIGAAVGHRHPLASLEAVSLDVLLGHDLIALPRGTGLRSRFDSACAAIGRQPRIAIESGDPRQLAQFAAAGLGAAIIPLSVVEREGLALQAITIIHPRMQARIGLAWRTANPSSPAMQAFLAHAEHALPGPA